MKEIKLVLLAVLFAVPLFAQPEMRSNSGPELTKWAWRIEYDASGNIEYYGKARAFGHASGDSATTDTFTWRRSTSTITNIVDAANVATVTLSAAHGLQPGCAITVAGATVDTDLNGTYIVVTADPAATTLTFASASVTDATYTDATMTITTACARTTQPIWDIVKYFYDGSNRLIRKGESEPRSIFNNRTTLAYR